MEDGGHTPFISHTTFGCAVTGGSRPACMASLQGVKHTVMDESGPEHGYLEREHKVGGLKRQRGMLRRERAPNLVN